MFICMNHVIYFTISFSRCDHYFSCGMTVWKKLTSILNAMTAYCEKLNCTFILIKTICILVVTICHSRCVLIIILFLLEICEICLILYVMKRTLTGETVVRFAQESIDFWIPCSCEIPQLSMNCMPLFLSTRDYMRRSKCDYHIVVSPQFPFSILSTKKSEKKCLHLFHIEFNSSVEEVKKRTFDFQWTAIRVQFIKWGEK